MPNWCENDLRIEGPRERLLEFLAFVKGPNGPLDFDRILPCPQEYAVLDDDVAGFYSPGCSWCNANWGTKWNAEGATVEELDNGSTQDASDASVTIHFDTAWSPPSLLIPIVSQRFPDLRFDLQFYECGFGFQGRLRCRGGMIDEECIEDYDGNRGG
jgi:hypothetical protein